MDKESGIIVEQDKAKSSTFVETVKTTINGEDDWFIRDKASARITALEEDGECFGLLPHEQQELESLKKLVNP